MTISRNVATRFALAAALVVTLWPTRAAALERLCDPAFEDCRAPLLTLINSETQGLDVAFWFMTETKFSDAIIARWRAGVPVRVLMDTEANAAHPGNSTILSQLKSAGIPMREKTSTGILHWKLMIFAGQRTVEWSGANYSTVAFMPGSAYTDYEDEIIHFTDDDLLVNSFETKYDDIWTTTSGYSNYSNAASPTRRYPTYPIDPELNFPPYENYRTRAVARYNAEAVGIDVSMFRITDRAHADAMIAAKNRGVPVRLIADPTEYRNPDRLWDAYNVDRMYAAGISLKFIAHAGISHEKLVLLTGQGMAIFGSSNWSSPSAASQLEHNLFTTRAELLPWLRAHWNRKWNNTGPAPETKAFVPLPPSTPTLKSPANGATGIATSVSLKWWAGKWAHKYDVYVGTSCNSLSKVASDVELGPSETETDYVAYTVSNLAGNTTYCWKVVSRTMAGLTATSATSSFSTGTSSGGSGGTITLTGGWTSKDIGTVGAAGTASVSGGTFTVKGSGADIWGTADEFRFVYKQLTGDGSIVARVTGITNQNAWSKAGVMMRETLNAGSKHATMFVSSAKGLAFQRRTSTNGTSASTAGALASAPYWVKVTRSGATFTAYQSSNGLTWTAVGSATMNMTATIYVGLAVTSHADGALSTGTFDNVQ
jgi:phosphatidylserine/phosphatidylglycerophosphate/cardiolipin synthase-like enzyme